MQKEIIVDTSLGEVRVALVENGKLVELYYEHEDADHYAGDIFKGRVEDVLPGLGSAFVDIGHEKRGLLHASDVVVTGIEDIDELFLAQSGSGGSPSPGEGRNHIGDVLRPGQSIIVQVTKESIGEKGPKLTTAVALPGRYLVLTPFSDRVNISSRIENEAERTRLRQLVEETRPQGHGFIVRTAATHIEPDFIFRDMEDLLDTWRRVTTKAERKRAPTLLYKDKDLLERILRDQFTGDVDTFIVDSLATYERVTELAGNYAPLLVSRVRLYEDEHHIFDAYGVEAEIDRMFRRKIWLRSGGYIVIDEAEALVAIDVNTGRFLGREDQEDTILKTNLEAAAEIARQVRLRNVGGIIIIDFIDMTIPRNKELVLEKLREHMSRDRARSKILELSELGMVEMTRQRQRGSLTSALSRMCPYCRGRGTVLELDVLGAKIKRELALKLQEAPGGELTIVVHPRVKNYLDTAYAEQLNRIELEYDATVHVVTREDMPLDDVDFIEPTHRADKPVD
ncbi:MAG: Rne/Rng family ribonuclease [Candidatus Zixiibacteriota bacterium]|jgi:ribonuclease G